MLIISLTILILIVLVLICLWPQKTGDVKNINGSAHIYWRGPDPHQPGEWLPRDDTISPNATYDGLAATVDGRVVIDCVRIGGGRCIVVFDDRLAAIVKVR